MPRNASRVTSRIVLPARARTTAFDPRSMPGLLAWYRSDSGVYKDSIGTPPNNGNSVYQWSDISGNGNHCIQATAGSQPSYTTKFVNGLPVVTFAGKYLTCINSPFPTASGASHEYTVAAVVYPTSFNMGVICAGTLGGTSNRSFVGTGSGNLIVYQGANAAASLQGFPNTAWYSMIGTYSKNQQMAARVWMSGIIVGSGQASNDVLDPALQIGAVAAGVSTFSGNMAEIIVFNRKLSDGEVLTVHNYFAGRYGIIPLSQVPFIVFEGNSLTYGQNASSGQGGVTGTVYPGVVMSALSGGPFVGTNVGISGTTTQQIMARALGRVTGLAGPGRRSILCFWEITNDLVGNYNNGSYGVNAQTQAYSNVVNYCQTQRQSGYRVVVFTCLPRSVGGNFETDRLAVNSLIRSNWATFADTLADVGSDAVIGQLSTTSNATYYNADGIHLTDAGYAIVANSYAIPAIQSIW